jgi:hypothetical protein
MKKNKIIQVLAITFLTVFSLTLSAQPPAPNNGNGAPGGGNTPVGGGAPIGTGLAILLALGLGYGGKKVYEVKKRNLVE